MLCGWHTTRMLPVVAGATKKVERLGFPQVVVVAGAGPLKYCIDASSVPAQLVPVYADTEQRTAFVSANIACRKR